MSIINNTRRLSSEEVRRNFEKQKADSIARAKRIAEEVRVASALRAKNDKIMAERAAEYRANRAIEIQAAEYMARKEATQNAASSLRDKILSAYQGRAIQGKGGRFLRKTGT